MSESQTEDPSLLSEGDPLSAIVWEQVRDQVFLSGLDSVNRAAGVIYLATLLEGEIYNGGFHQFFFNHSGNYTLATLAALEEINAREGAELLQLAIDLYFRGRAPSSSWEERRDQLQAAGDADDGSGKAWIESSAATPIGCLLC
jgi:hypothetical protein